MVVDFFVVLMIALGFCLGCIGSFDCGDYDPSNFVFLYFGCIRCKCIGLESQEPTIFQWGVSTISMAILILIVLHNSSFLNPQTSKSQCWPSPFICFSIIMFITTWVNQVDPLGEDPYTVNVYIPSFVIEVWMESS